MVYIIKFFIFLSYIQAISAASCDRDNYISCPEYVYSHAMSLVSKEPIWHDPINKENNLAKHKFAFNLSGRMLASIAGKEIEEIMYQGNGDPHNLDYIVRIKDRKNKEKILSIVARFRAHGSWCTLTKTDSAKGRPCYQMSMAWVRDSLSTICQNRNLEKHTNDRIKKLLENDLDVVRALFVVDQYSKCSIYAISESLSSCILIKDEILSLLPRKITLSGMEQIINSIEHLELKDLENMYPKDSQDWNGGNCLSSESIIDFSNIIFDEEEFKKIKEILSNIHSDSDKLIDMSNLTLKHLDWTDILGYFERELDKFDFIKVLKLCNNNLSSQNLLTIYNISKKEKINFIDISNNGFYIDDINDISDLLDENFSKKLIFEDEGDYISLDPPYKESHKCYYENY